MDGVTTMSASMDEAIERQRNLLYAPKTDEQLIMIALHHLLEGAGLKMPALQRELYDRYYGERAIGAKQGGK
jgi:hypothetical protein